MKCLPAVRCATVLLVLAAGGCSTAFQLKEPDNIPALVESYEIPGLRKYVSDVPVVLDLSACVEKAALSSSSFSGSSSIAGCFPVRELVQREFKKVIVSNFRPVLPGEQPKLVLEVRSDRVQVSRSWSKVKSRMTFSVRIVDPVSTDVKPYFSRQYEVGADVMQKDKGEVPVCVYEDIQNLAKSFLEDIPREQSGALLTRLKELGVSVSEQSLKLAK